MHKRALAATGFVAIWLATAAMGQDLGTTDVSDAPAAPITAGEPRPLARIDPNKNVILKFDVRAGVTTRPAYFGSDEYTVGPDFAVKFDYAKIRGLGDYGSLDDSAPPSAFGIRGSLRFIGERDDDDYDELEGLEDIDPSLELGLGLVYRERNFEAFGDVRYGVLGHQNFVGELGMDAIAYPTDNWEFRVGPRFSFADGDFADLYFGVDDSEAAASGLSTFKADGGLLGAGIEATARYRFNDLWGLEAAIRADRLLNDAADSPITEAGSEDQFRFRIGITRELVLQF
ncbi:MipA/OmpV family protein [Tropicimonas sediminicola]|uniref:Outer membrane scaffolding protein for murein synthesis, MipA/OmpV family n=1 Tax=Tropicimonas sediminicola TaxID=1031541 RepID=A0A239KH11_9RHOB|nr:MipA/OmpV family protein [Tropicimonas sediminicola]SNT17365.1 Outer membrane scaffolding protein for murein synthesis, MipA/OmpV family [Tropicimonas sediminicola]